MKREPEQEERGTEQSERPQYSPPQALRLGQVVGGARDLLVSRIGG